MNSCGVICPSAATSSTTATTLSECDPHYHPQGFQLFPEHSFNSMHDDSRVDNLGDLIAAIRPRAEVRKIVPSPNQCTHFELHACSS